MKLIIFIAAPGHSGRGIGPQQPPCPRLPDSDHFPGWATRARHPRCRTVSKRGLGACAEPYVA